MTTTQTDAIMAMADRYAFHIPGSQHSDEARAALLAALQEQAPKRLWGMAGFNPPLPNVGEKYTSIHEDDLGDHVTVTGIANASSPNIAYVFLSWDDGHYGERAIDEFWQEYMMVQTNDQAREGEAVAIKDAVGCVLEGWTLPEPVRKILETAYYAAPQPAQPSDIGIPITQPEQGEPLDRSDAVNLARNVIEKERYLPKAVTPKGVEILCRAVLSMDAALQSAQPVAQPLPLTDELTSIKEMGKLAFRAMDKAATVINTIEPESDSERDSLQELTTEMHDVAMSLFTVCGLPMQEAERYFYKKQSHGIGGAL